MGEVDKVIPSVVFDARDPKGQSVADVKVTMDGTEVLQTKLDGTAVQVDPGNHAFHFEMADGTSGDQQVLVLEGEKARVITFTVGGAAATSGGNTTQPPATPPDQPSGGGSKTLAYVVGGVGVASLAVGIIFGAMGSSQASNDKSSSGCAPSPPNSALHRRRSQLNQNQIDHLRHFHSGRHRRNRRRRRSLLGERRQTSASTSTGVNLAHGVRLDASPTRDGATFGLHGSF